MLPESRKIEYAVFNIVHALINFFCTVAAYFRNVSRKFKGVLGFVIPSSIYAPASWTSEQNLFDFQKFKKNPKHIGIAINETVVSLPDLSKLILWSATIGIRQISLYDAKGFIKDNSAALYKEMILRKSEYLINTSKMCNIIFRKFKTEIASENAVTNGHIVETVVVHLLSAEDTHSHIVSATRDVCYDVAHKLLSKVSTETLNSYISEITTLSDPEVILLFGSVCSLMGYLPWHVRLSEILNLPTHHNLHITDFSEAFKSYQNCEQRFGK